MDSSQQTSDIYSLPEWAKSANIYEVNIRQYTPEGSFTAFQKHLPRLKEMGVDILWFMPVYPISETKKKGSLGSYYAVSNFRETNPKFGSMVEFQSIIDQAHQLGMKVILDWVPNHTGWDHVWIKEHPEYYTKDSIGNIIDPLNEHGESMGWADVADLNYNNADTRTTMINDMLYWVNEHHIDGFRQDMALLVPLNFWEQVSSALRKVKSDVFLLAESEVQDHLNKTYFNSMYAWSLHHTLNDIAKGKKKATSIDEWRRNENSKLTAGSYLHFTSNHDENSWSGSEIERMGEAHQTFAVLINMLDGIPLTYSGQEEPMAKRLEFFEKDDIGFKDYAYQEFYRKLNELRHKNPALWHRPYGGSFESIIPDENVYSILRVKDEHKVFAFMNLSNQLRTIQMDRDVKGRELFSNRDLNITQGMKLTLKPWEFRVISH